MRVIQQLWACEERRGEEKCHLGIESMFCNLKRDFLYIYNIFLLPEKDVKWNMADFVALRHELSFTFGGNNKDVKKKTLNGKLLCECCVSPCKISNTKDLLTKVSVVTHAYKLTMVAS